MRKVKAQATARDIRPEYDFSGGVRGKYYRRFQRGTNVVVLEPDVSAAFPDSASVNDALRALASVARRTTAVTRRARSAQKRRHKRTQLIGSAKARRRKARS